MASKARKKAACNTLREELQGQCEATFKKCSFGSLLSSALLLSVFFSNEIEDTLSSSISAYLTSTSAIVDAVSSMVKYRKIYS